jgi:hypothetical protein
MIETLSLIAGAIATGLLVWGSLLATADQGKRKEEDNPAVTQYVYRYGRGA